MFSKSSPIKPFRYVDLCETQSSSSLCDVEIGKVRIDCCVRMSKTQWGKLHKKDSGVLYFDLTFHHALDCKLAEATITMKFYDNDKFRRQPDPSDLEVTEYYGPQILSGEPRQKRVLKTIEAKPRFGAYGLSAEGLKCSRTSDASYCSRWKFTSSRFAGSSKSDKHSRSTQYRELIWHLEENELERQSSRQPIVHTALAFHHHREPFFIDLEIQVKMHRWRDRIKQSLTSLPRNQKPRTIALVTPTSITSAMEDTKFSILAQRIDDEMKKQNMYLVPEVSDPEQAASGNLLRPEEDAMADNIWLSMNDEILGLMAGVSEPKNDHTNSIASAQNNSGLVVHTVTKSRPNNSITTIQNNTGMDFNEATENIAPAKDIAKLKTTVEPGKTAIDVYAAADKHSASKDAKIKHKAVEPNKTTIIETRISEPDLSLTTTTLVRDGARNDFRLILVTFMYQVPRALATVIAFLITGLTKLHSVLKETKQ